MKISITVHNNVGVIIAEMFISAAVRLKPRMSPRTVEGRLAIQQMENALTQRVYAAIQGAIRELETNTAAPRGRGRSNRFAVASRTGLTQPKGHA